MSKTSTESFASAVPESVTSWSQIARKVGAEMIGTFALVFVGCGAIMVNAQAGGTITHVGIGLTFGLVIMVMIYATGHISGAHFNPAVTLAFAAVGRFSWRQLPLYIAGQVIAAIAASLALAAILGHIADLGTTSPSGTSMQSLLVEGILTFFLMFVITSVATDARAMGQMAGWAIGGMVALGAIFAGPISGASMNPARSIGPALVAGQFQFMWLYVAGPIVGAVLGAAAYQLIRCGGEAQSAGGCC